MSAKPRMQLVSSVSALVFQYMVKLQCSQWICNLILAVYVLAHPTFIVKPKDQRVGMNGIAKFECQAGGNPPPSVFWTKEGNLDLMFAGTTHGQMHVSSEGTLVIQVSDIPDPLPSMLWLALLNFFHREYEKRTTDSTSARH